MASNPSYGRTIGVSSRRQVPTTSYISTFASTKGRTYMRVCGGIVRPTEAKGLADPSALDISSWPGVYNRFSTAGPRRSSSSSKSSVQWIVEKFPCSQCNKKMMCLCQNCVIQKTRLNNKRSQLKEKERLKRDLAVLIEKELQSEINLRNLLDTTRESIESIKVKINEKRKLNKKMQESLANLASQLQRHFKNVESLQGKCVLHKKVLAGHNNPQEDVLRKMQSELTISQNKRAAAIFKIFPIEMQLPNAKSIAEYAASKHIREQIAEASMELGEAKEKAWTMLADDEAENVSPVHFKVCGFEINDSSAYDLKEWLKVGIPNTISKLACHRTFAALMCTIHLVNTLSYIFDLCNPEQLFLRDFALCENWNDDLYDTDIFKLNLSVIHLCLDRGVEPSFMEPKRPLCNLLCLKHLIETKTSNFKPSQLMMSDSLVFKLESDLRKICWTERDLSDEDDWCLVQGDDIYDEDCTNSTLRAISSSSDLQQMLEEFNDLHASLPSSHSFVVQSTSCGNSASRRCMKSFSGAFGNAFFSNQK